MKATEKLKKVKTLLLALVMIIGMIFPLSSVNAEYVSDSDATMTVKWNLDRHESWEDRFNKVGLKIIVKDMNGNNIKLSNKQKTKKVTIKTDYTDTDISELGASIAGYTLAYATVDGKSFGRLAPWYNENKEYQYHYKNGNTNVLQDTVPKNGIQSKTVIFYYSKTMDKLETIETVDSTSKGIDLKVYDYNATEVNKKSNLKFGTDPSYSDDWNINHDSSVTKGIVENKLEYNSTTKRYGDPILSNKIVSDGDGSDGIINNSSLSYLFSDNGSKKNANHLFKMDDGYYYYNSDENYAYYNNNSGNFSVYNVAGAPSGDAAAYKKGNFFPYNQLSTNSRYIGITPSGSALYNFETGNNGTTKNVHFGMTMDTMFIQPKDGKIDGKNMAFEFAGDDDVWVYIDGVLVLDIGGIHAVQGGSIDFATGKTYINNKETTTLYDIMKSHKDKAYLEENFVEVNGKMVFKNYTDHNIKFYYLERGAGASNCKLKFNIQSVPRDSIRVTKQVENINEGSFSDVEFEFKLYLESEETSGSDIITIDGTNYKLYKGKETVDGLFKLKHGQTVEFKEIAEVGTKYIVQEVGLNQDEYDEVTVDGTVYNPDSGNVTGEEGDYIVTTTPQIVGTDVSVIFYNKCNPNNWHDIIINKKMSNGLSSGDTFKMKVEIGGELFDGKYTINGTEKTANNGIIEMKANDIIKISKIAAGTSFKVSEIDLDTNLYKTPTYSFDGNNALDYSQSPDSTISNGVSIESKVIKAKNAELTITNEAHLTQLVINKTITKADFADGDPIFTFKISNKDGSLILYRTIRFTDENFNQDQNNTKSVTITGLPVGQYTVEELSTIRYTPEGETIKVVNLINIDGGTVNFKNNLVYDKDFSHTDVVENKFTIADDGSVTITQEWHEKKELSR